MGLAVINPGFGRTGTLSLKLALEQLGFGPCHHMEEVFQKPEQVPHWERAAKHEPVDWNAVFDGYRAQVDWPGAHVWRDLLVAFPDAKVVMSVRPEDKWWNSFSGTILKLFQTHDGMPLPPHVRAMLGAADAMIIQQTFGGRADDRDTAIAAFRKRLADVKATVPADRLLVFDVAQGWEPLCAFLGVPVPDTPFPHRNTTTEFWEIVSGGPKHAA